MSKKGFDQVWDYLPHFSFYQLGLTCGISTMAVNCGLWVLWSVFGFYRPGRYRCSNVLDQQDMVSEHFWKKLKKSRYKEALRTTKAYISLFGTMNFTEKENLLAYPDDSSCQYYDINSSELEACIAVNSNNNLASCIQELKSEENLKYCTRSGFGGHVKLP